MMSFDSAPAPGNQSASAVKDVISFVERGVRDNAFRDDGRLPTENEICSAGGVSRTPVREAMKILDAMGVVEIRRGIGTFLRPQAGTALGCLVMFQSAMTMATPQQLFETRLMVERTAAELAADRRTESDLKAIRDANERMRIHATVQPADLDKITEADIAFHDAVFDASHNPLISAMGKFVVNLFAPWIQEGHRVAGGMVSVRNHELIIQAIETRNSGKAREAAFDRSVHEGLARWQARLEGPPPDNLPK